MLPKKKNDGVELQNAFGAALKAKINKMTFMNNDLLVNDDKFTAGKLKPLQMRNNSIDRIMRIEGGDFEKNNKVVDLMRRMQLNKEQIFHQRKKSEQAEAERQQQLKKVNSTRFLRNDDLLVPPPNRTITQSRSKGALQKI